MILSIHSVYGSAEAVRVERFDPGDLLRRQRGKLVLPCAPGKLAAVLAEEAEERIEGSLRHIYHVFDAGAELVEVCQEPGFVGDVLLNGLLDAGIEKFGVRRCVDEPVEIPRPYRPSQANRLRASRISDAARRAGTLRAWNRLAIEEKHDALSRLTPPVLKRTPYWIDVAKWPSGLREDLDAFLEHLATPSCFTGAPARKLKPTTIQQYRHNIRILVSAAVARGANLDSMQRLTDVIVPANVDRALMFLHERSGSRVTHQMFQLMLKARKIAEWRGLPGDIRVSLDKMFESVKNELPRRRGLTAKNRELLDRLDDQRFRDLVYILPQLLFAKAKKAQGKSSPALVRTAIAMELLITCSMRRENLMKLELDRSIRKIGRPPNDYWIIEIAPEEVKNEEPLRFTLPEPTAELLETYLAEWRPKLCEVPNAWVFPGKGGSPMDPKLMSWAITSLAQKILGTRITPHQFRHMSAELFLREQPDGLYTISQHLGHRDPNTTRTYYARSKQREASRRYQERVVLDRAEAKKRLRIRKHRERDTP